MSILEWFLIAFFILQYKSSINHRNANTVYVISFAVELVMGTKLIPPEPSKRLRSRFPDMAWMVAERMQLFGMV